MLDIMPRDDLIDHEPGTGCVCMPGVMSVWFMTEVPRVADLIAVHSPLDGREASE